MKVGELVYNGALGMGLVIADVNWCCRVVQWNRGNKTCISRRGAIEPYRSHWKANGNRVRVMNKKREEFDENFSLSFHHPE